MGKIVIFFSLWPFQNNIDQNQDKDKGECICMQKLQNLRFAQNAARLFCRIRFVRIVVHIEEEKW